MDVRARWYHARHCGPRTLVENDVPCIIWAEDALDHYGVPTGLNDLFCLVEDTEVAASCLQSHGFSELAESTMPGYQMLPELAGGHPRLTNNPSPNDLTAAVVLLPAADWKYPLRALSRDCLALFPDLDLFFKSIVDRWLDAREPFFVSHLQVWIGYLSGYVSKFHDTAFTDSLNLAYYKELHDEYLKQGLKKGKREHFQKRRAETRDESTVIPIVMDPLEAREGPGVEAKILQQAGDDRNFDGSLAVKY